MFDNIIANVRKETPLVHSITNYVTVNDCANILLACGGSPIMADDVKEAADITAICKATVINIGTLNERTVESMVIAGKKANEIGNPVILDPVGAGASGFRTETVFRLLREVRFSLIRGNISEIKTIYAGSGNTQGVDADIADRITEDNLSVNISWAKELANSTRAVIAITGPIDIVTDGKKAYIIRNGTAKMAGVTGTGCMLSCVAGAFCAANKDRLVEAAASAVAAMGICGEIAEEKIIAMNGGSSSFRMYLIDAMSQIDDETCKERCSYEER